MDSEMISEKTKIAIEKFHGLNGDTFKEKKKSLNSFIKGLQPNFTSEEIQDFIKNLNTNTEYDHVLKAEIIVRFQLNSSIWDILKSGNEAIIGKILKNWVFFKNIFTGITVDSFVNEVLPLLSYKTSLKVIRAIGKNFTNNEQLSDELFKKLQKKYGIKTAKIVLSTCSIALIKEKCSKYNIKLSSRSLLQIYKRDHTFLFYYFDLINIKENVYILRNSYIQIVNYIIQTDLSLFWSLYNKYKFHFNFGNRLTQRILPDKECVTKYGFNNKHMFRNKCLLRAVRKVGLHKELLLQSYPNNLHDYLNDYLRHSYNSLIIRMPRNQVFSLLNELFKEKYQEDLTDYLEFLDREYLKYVTVSERIFILDKLTDRENWLDYYPTNKCIPILKEKLKSANDQQTRRKLIISLYNTCDINNDEKALLEVLKLLYNRYKNDTSVLMEVLQNLVRWKNYNTFTEEHWEIIHTLIEYLNYSNIYVDEHHFFERYFVWLVDNDKPIAKLLDEYVVKRNEMKSLHTVYCFNKSMKHMKIFIEEIHKRLEGKLHILHVQLLSLAVEFDKRFRNEINILNYSYILDMVPEYPPCRTIGAYYYFIKHYNMDKSFNKYIKYFDNRYRIDRDILIYCLNNCPDELENFKNLYKKIRWPKIKLRVLVLCPYFTIRYLDTYKKIATDKLRNKEVEVEDILLYFLSYNTELIELIKEFEPQDKAKIEPQTDKIFISKQKLIIKYIPSVSCPQNMLLVRKFCKGDYLKYALGALYKIAYKSPEIFLLEFLQNIYKSAVSVRKHALFLGRHLLPVNLYHDFLISSSSIERNMSMRNILLKKSLEYFIESFDIKFFNLFVSYLEMVDKNDRDLFDDLLKYEKMPKEFIGKYVTTVYDNMISNEDEEIRKKRFQLMENLPFSAIDDLELDFMKRYLLNAKLANTNFINKCLFHTTGEKRYEIQNFIFQLIIDNLKNCNPRSLPSRNVISNMILNICKKAIIYSGNDSIIEQLYEIYKTYHPQHCFITITIQLDFSIILLKSKRNIDIFAKEINVHLSEFTKLYSFSIISLYTGELKSFLNNNSIDKFEFIKHFFNIGTGNDATYLIAIAFLPNHIPSEKNAYAKYMPILNSLSTIQTASVLASLDVYFSRVYE